MFSPVLFTPQKRSLPPQPKAPSFPTDADWALHCDKVLNNPHKDYPSKVNAALVVWNSLARMDRRIFEDKNNEVAIWIQWHTMDLIIGGPWETIEMKTKAYYQTMLMYCIIDKKDTISFMAEHIIKILYDPWQKSFWNEIKAIERGETMKAPDALSIGMELIIRLQTLCKREDKSAALQLASPLVRIICSRRHCIKGVLNEDAIHFVEDVYFTLMHEVNTTSEIVISLKDFPLSYGVNLIHRYVKDPPYRVWNTKWDIAVILADYFLAVALMKPIKETADILRDLVREWVMLHKITNFDINLLPDVIRKLLLGVESACQIYTMCEVLSEEHGEMLRPLCIELYIRALTTDLNVLEQHKLKPCAATCQEVECRLSKGFLMLGELLKTNIGAHRECLLSAFSLNPSKDMYGKIENIAHISKMYLDNTDGRIQTIENDHDYSNHSQIGCFQDVIVEDEHQLGLSKQLRDDLIVLLNSSRYQDLSWASSWEDLRKVCMNYVKFGKSVTPTKDDLKYLNIDYYNQRPFENTTLEQDNFRSNTLKKKAPKTKPSKNSATYHNDFVKLTNNTFHDSWINLKNALGGQNNSTILPRNTTTPTINSQIHWNEFNMNEWTPLWNSDLCNSFERTYNPFGNVFDTNLWKKPFNICPFDPIQMPCNSLTTAYQYYLSGTLRESGEGRGLRSNYVNKVSKKNRTGKSSNLNSNVRKKNDIWFQEAINCVGDAQNIILKRASTSKANYFHKTNEGGKFNIVNYIPPNTSEAQEDSCTRRSERVFLRT